MFRLSVRKLLLLSTVLFISVAVGLWVKRSLDQKSCVDYVLNQGGIVRYDFQLDQDLQLTYKLYPDWYPKFFVDLFGYDFFSDAVEIDLSSIDHYSQDKPLDLEILSNLGKTEILRLDTSYVINSIKLGKLQNLRILELPSHFDGQNETEREITDINASGKSNEDDKFSTEKTDALNTLKNLSFLKDLSRLEKIRLPYITGVTTLPLLKNNFGLRQITIVPPQLLISDNANTGYCDHFDPDEFLIVQRADKLFSDYPSLSDKTFIDFGEIQQTIVSLDQLESFVLFSDASDPEFTRSLSGFSNLENLRNLQLISAGDIDVSIFSNHKQMHDFLVAGNKINNIHAVSKFRELHSLTVFPRDYCPPIKNLNKLTQLEEINLKYVGLESIDVLKPLKRLKATSGNNRHYKRLHPLLRFNQNLENLWIGTSMKRPGFFDFQNRVEEIAADKSALNRIKAEIDWEIFRPILEKILPKERKSNAGRKRFDLVFMFKVLVLQSLYNLSDAQTEFQIKDRISFMNFLDLGLGDRVPDEKTIWEFRENLKNLQLLDELFERFSRIINESGFSAKKGQIVDASIVPSPKQRNTREENRSIKNDETPKEWKKDSPKTRQKDTDARWVQKRKVNHFGYKNHINIDVKNKFIREYDVTNASVHDSKRMLDLLDPNNSSREVYGDSAYRSKEMDAELKRLDYKNKIHEKGYRGKPLTENQISRNRQKSKKRVRVEHVFGVQYQMAGSLILRTIGLARATVKVGLRNLSYNINRLAMLVS